MLHRHSTSLYHNIHNLFQFYLFIASPKTGWLATQSTHPLLNRELKKTPTATATALKKRFNEQKNGCARVL